MPEKDKEKGNIKEKLIWFKKLIYVIEKTYVGGKDGGCLKVGGVNDIVIH